MSINQLSFLSKNNRSSAVFCQTIFVVSVGVVLAACQSSPYSGTQGAGKKNPRIVAHPEKPIQTRQPIQKLTPLQGTTWQILEIKGRVASIHVERPWMQLSNQTNRIQGSTGCNPLWGEYTLGTNSALKLRGYNGRRNCAYALVQEANLLDAFDQTVTYRLDAAGLVLLDNRQNVLLRATATARPR
ncbi:MAG: META domain-containing protein [Pseudomonadota bacterium]|nr:META domain-containing protein [Pseudomonadota bacterium]